MGACFNAGVLMLTLRKRGVFTPLAGWKKLFIAIFVGAALLVVYLGVIQHYVVWTELTLRWLSVRRCCILEHSPLSVIESRI